MGNKTTEQNCKPEMHAAQAVLQQSMARPGPESAQFEACRRRLLSIAYRMLGNLSEAEDIVQETWIRWHEADHAGMRTPVAWLTTVATRLSIDRLRALKRERAADPAPWLPDPWLEPHAPNPEDAVSMLSELSYGVLLLLERLTPDERAALLLHEAFDCQYDEIARTLDKKPAHCRQLVKRARARVQAAHAAKLAQSAKLIPPRPASAPANGRQPLGQETSERLVRDFLYAIQNQDKGLMLQLVAPNAVIRAAGAASTVGAVGAVAESKAVLSCVGAHHSAAGFIDALASPQFSGCSVACANINGQWGGLVSWRGTLVLALSFETSGAHISAIYAVASLGKPMHAAYGPRVGQEAPACVSVS